MVSILKLGMNELISLFYKDKVRSVKIFSDIIYQYLRQDSIVLNAGCGIYDKWGIRGKCRRVVGVDLDARIYSNLDIDYPVVANIENVDLESEHFDLIICQWLVEHLENPVNTFANFRRILKKDGTVLIFTANRFHYVSLAYGITPKVIREKFYDLLDTEQEPFKVFYRSNTPTKLENNMKQAGFKTVELKMIEPEPDYFELSTPTFLFGVAMERLHELGFMKPLRRDIIGVFKKNG
jgi:SAM-dependent methyltransferase